MHATVFDMLFKKKKKKASFLVGRLEQGKPKKGKYIRGLKGICYS